MYYKARLKRVGVEDKCLVACNIAANFNLADFVVEVLLPVGARQVEIAPLDPVKRTTFI